MEVAKAKIKAVKNVSTEKPGTKYAAKRTITASKTQVKNPNVKIFIGNESNTNMGFTKIFNRAITTDARRAIQKSGTDTPSKYFATRKTTKPFAKK